ncbi:hypothetical protein FBULB1_3144 [Fusarium bulbicola]|nr:hypothetical protein FBULB1_3144 [Fusarium bulbicola]
MVILEIQERLMDFLIKCCHQILHDIEPDNLFSDFYPVRPEPELLPNTQTQGIQTSLLEITVGAPYRVPTRLDFANLEKLFAAKAAAAEDHIWAMREDPNYFVEQISDMHDHVQLIGFRRKHTSTWGAAIGDVLTNAYTLVEWVIWQIHDARNIMDRHSVVPNIYVMNQAINDLELQVERDKAILDLLSPTARAMLGDFAIIIQTLHALERFEPWSRGFGQSPNDPSMKWSHDIIGGKIDIWGEFKEAIQMEPAPDLVQFREPNLGKFAYPVNRRRNKENVEMMRRAEWNLDAFWARVDRYLYDRTKNMDESILMGLLKSPRVLQRTPEWVEPTKEKKKVLDIEQPLSTFFFGLSSDERDTKASGRLSVKPTKAKLKTRGTTTEAIEADEAPAEAMAEVALEDPKPVFKVDRRALKTFRILFHDPAITSTPGEIPWNDFLHASTSVGLAAEKLYGSVWQFSPHTLEANKNIHFHEPHPHSKVPYLIARRLGRRLYQTYEWTGEQFVLDK